MRVWLSDWLAVMGLARLRNTFVALQNQRNRPVLIFGDCPGLCILLPVSTFGAVDENTVPLSGLPFGIEITLIRSAPVQSVRSSIPKPIPPSATLHQAAFQRLDVTGDPVRVRLPTGWPLWVSWYIALRLHFQ